MEARALSVASRPDGQREVNLFGDREIPSTLNEVTSRARRVVQFRPSFKLAIVPLDQSGKVLLGVNAPIHR